MEKVKQIKGEKRAEGAACVLGVGISNPPNIIYQKDFPDYFFRVTNSEHMADLKDKLKRICEKSKITKRHFLLTEETLKANPCLLTYGAPSMDARRAMTVEYAPKLAAEAALKAIDDWGRPKSEITHLLVHNTLALSMPGVDYQVMKALGLDPSVQRTAFYLLGCYAGPHLLRAAMDIAENNRGARVLLVSVELTTVNFHGPSHDNLDSLVGQALFADGAGALVVGADPNPSTERPLFELIHGHQLTVPETVGVGSEILEMGQTIHLKTDLPHYAKANAERCLLKALEPIGLGKGEWNSLFWLVHNGAPGVLDDIEAALGLEGDKLDVTRHVLSEYGHLGSASVYFMMHEMRRMSVTQGKATSGLGFEWGLMLGYGPGLTMEALALRSVPLEE